MSVTAPVSEAPPVVVEHVTNQMLAQLQRPKDGVLFARGWLQGRLRADGFRVVCARMASGSSARGWPQGRMVRVVYMPACGCLRVVCGWPGEVIRHPCLGAEADPPDVSEDHQSFLCYRTSTRWSMSLSSSLCWLHGCRLCRRQSRFHGLQIVENIVEIFDIQTS